MNYQKEVEHGIHACGRRQRGQWGHAPWIFIHKTDKVEGGLILMVPFFGLVFPLPPPLLEIFLPTHLQSICCFAKNKYSGHFHIIT